MPVCSKGRDSFLSQISYTLSFRDTWRHFRSPDSSEGQKKPKDYEFINELWWSLVQDSFQFLFCFGFSFVCLFFNQHVPKVCSMLGTVPIPQKGRSENDQRPHILSLWENQELKGKEKQAVRDSGAATLARSKFCLLYNGVYVHACMHAYCVCACPCTCMGYMCFFFDMVLHHSWSSGAA